MNSEKLTDDQLVELLVKTIKQVLATRPQLLYRACRQCNSDYFLEKISAELDHKTRKTQHLLLRGAICMRIMQLLIQSGYATLDDYDKQSVAAYLNFVAGDK